VKFRESLYTYGHQLSYLSSDLIVHGEYVLHCCLEMSCCIVALQNEHNCFQLINTCVHSQSKLWLHSLHLLRNSYLLQDC
jgi:hypothetical protein